MNFSVQSNEKCLDVLNSRTTKKFEINHLRLHRKLSHYKSHLTKRHFDDTRKFVFSFFSVHELKSFKLKKRHVLMSQLKLNCSKY